LSNNHGQVYTRFIREPLNKSIVMYHQLICISLFVFSVLIDFVCNIGDDEKASTTDIKQKNINDHFVFFYRLDNKLS